MASIMAKARERSEFRKILDRLWCTQHAIVWFQAISRPGPDVCEDLLYVSLNTHAYWDKVYIALKPTKWLI